MSNIDNQRVAAVRKLEQLRYTFLPAATFRSSALRAATPGMMQQLLRSLLQGVQLSILPAS